ncbi:Transcriptional activator Myb [Hypsizygus marmoreus]|uniref:Transcriptional activator Myb n=1 Tax=Hypsizygus marmoreus TaxID=39966 RepID=A0A369K997_HYPMA|nr:Transcriptional activator Myb [Hypsizygus marmoreus]
MLCRERRSWTSKEDQLLRDAVEREDPDNPNPSKWHAIAKHVPNRTNKDCRKRWFAKMASDVVKGGWAPDEDEKLVKGIEKYGTRWSLVASVVQTRNSDQCAKRWTDTLNPAIDRTTWTSEADELLLQAVNEHGKVWTKIVKTYFPGRTGLSAKNRYNSITRFNAEHSRSTRARRKTPDLLPYLSHRKSESVSSSSSSVSPSTPSISIPDISSSPFSSSMDSASESYLFEALTGWSQSSSESPHDAASFYPSPHLFSKEQNLARGSLLALPPSQQRHSFDPLVNIFPDDSLLYTASHTAPRSTPGDTLFAKEFSQQHPHDHSNLYSFMSNDIYSTYSQQHHHGFGPNETANHLAIFDTVSSQPSLPFSLNWGSQSSSFDPNNHDRSKSMGSSFVF